MRRHLAIALLAFPLAASAATIDRLRAFVRDTQTARTPFTQTVTDKAGRVVQRSDGQFVLARPGKFRWSIEKPYKQLVVGDGDRVWIYDEDLNQVVVRKSGEAIGNTPAALLAGRDDVEKAFRWRELPAAGGLEWLGATPIAKEAAFTEKLLDRLTRGQPSVQHNDLLPLGILAFGKEEESVIGRVIPLMDGRGRKVFLER